MVRVPRRAAVALELGEPELIVGDVVMTSAAIETSAWGSRDTVSPPDHRDQHGFGLGS